NILVPRQLVTAVSANCTAVNSACRPFDGTLRSQYANQNRSGTASEHNLRQRNARRVLLDDAFDASVTLTRWFTAVYRVREAYNGERGNESCEHYRSPYRSYCNSRRFGRWIHHFCDFTGVVDPIQSELRWPSGSLAVRQRFGDRVYYSPSGKRLFI
ncbi:hypothetical protein ALC62_05777, partial [Cyphomyrmex costatus]